VPGKTDSHGWEVLGVATAWKKCGDEQHSSLYSQQPPLKLGNTSTYFAIGCHPNVHTFLPRSGYPASGLPRRWDGQEGTGGDTGSPGRSCVVEADPQPQTWHGNTALHPAVFAEDLGMTQLQKPKGTLWQATKVGPKQAIRCGRQGKNQMLRKGMGSSHSGDFPKVACHQGFL